MQKEINHGGIYFLDKNTEKVDIKDNINVTIIDLIESTSLQKDIFVGENSKVDYKFGAYKEAEFETTFNFEGDNSTSSIECLFLSKESENIKGNINVKIKKQNIHVETNIIGLIGNHGNIDVSGNIFVDKKLHNIKGNLHQYCIYLDDKGQARIVPKLEVNSNDVEAAHGARTEKLDENSLFYFTSKGISFDDSKRLLISSYISNFLGDIEDKEEFQNKFMNYVL